MSFGGANSSDPSLGGLHENMVGLDGRKKIRKRELISLQKTTLKEVTLKIIFTSVGDVLAILGDEFSVGSNGEMLIVQGYVLDNNSDQAVETELDVENDRLKILAKLFGEERANNLSTHVEDMILDTRHVLWQIERNF